MKKILHKVREHAHVLDHHHHPPPPEHQQQQQQQQQQPDAALKTTPYEDTALRTPPTIGDWPLGSNEDPGLLRGRRRSLSGPAPAPSALSNQPLTNYSRLPARIADPLGSAATNPPEDALLGHEHHQHPVSPPLPPSATRFPDIADTEYSHPSSVHAMPAARPRAGSAAQYRAAGVTASAQPASLSRIQPYSSASPTRASPDATSFSPTIPRKEVGSGSTAGLRPNQSLESARTGLADNAEFAPQALDDTANRLDKVVDLGTTVDTEVITTEAPAVIHEKVATQVHEIREEVIDREVHKHHIIHRILPVIDVEVLPPRHFVPTVDGKLVEVSADQIPGRHGHWDIVARSPGTAAQSGLPPYLSDLGSDPPTKTTTFQTEQGEVTRTETIIRHPLTLSSAAKDAGQSLPMPIDFQRYAEKHGLPVTAPAPVAPGTMKPLPNIGDGATASATSTASPATSFPANNPANAGPPLTQSGAYTVSHDGQPASTVILGVFPPAVTASTLSTSSTSQEPPLRPPPPPPKD